MRRLYWLRHGPTHQQAFTGWRDVPADLSDRAQIARTAALLPADALVVASDLQRASATAAAIMGARTRLPDQPGLREFDFGAWDGLHFTTVAERHPDLSRAYWEAPGDLAPPGGESWNTAAARIETTLQGLLAAHPDRPLILVAHLGAILTQVARATGETPAKTIGHHLRPLSLTEIHLDDSGRQLIRINHLP